MFKSFLKLFEFNIPPFKFSMQQEKEIYKPKKFAKPQVTKYKTPNEFKRDL